MSSPDDPYRNPYRAPGYVEQVAAPQRPGSPDDLDALRRFRWRMTAFGVLSLVFCVLCIFAGLSITLRLGWAADMPANRLSYIVSMASVTGGIWLLIGLGSCYKQVWAVRVGLVLGYLGLLGSLSRLNPCSILIVGVVIVLGHMATRAARDCRERGIPLTADPNRLEMTRASEFER